MLQSLFALHALSEYLLSPSPPPQLPLPLPQDMVVEPAPCFSMRCPNALLLKNQDSSAIQQWMDTILL